MTFGEILAQLVDRTPGALCAGLLAADGIPVDEYAAAGGDADLAATGVELQAALEQLRKSSAVAGLGEPREITLTSESACLYLRWIEPDLYLLVRLERDAVVGKLRYLAARLDADLREAL
jgi:predicted regulator of Ras-like GTPase activity (Roadblock/LC7/MglB family)